MVNLYIYVILRESFEITFCAESNESIYSSWPLLNYLTWILAKNESTTEYEIESIMKTGAGEQLKNLINEVRR